MAEEDKEYNFESVMKSFIQKMGFTVESVDLRMGGTIDFLSKTTNPMGGDVMSLIRASPSSKPVTLPDIEDLYLSMQKRRAVRAAYITISSFTLDAEEYAKDKPLSLISKYQLLDSVEKRGLTTDKDFMDSLDKFGLGERHFQGSEQSFIPSRDERGATQYFEAKTVKHGLFGSKKGDEVPVKITLRYAPVSVYKLVTSKYYQTESKDLRVVEKRDFMFVNLNNLDLYYIKQKRRKSSVEMSFNKSDILEKIVTLPEDSKALFMNLLEHGDLPFDDLEGMDLSILKNKKIINIYEGKKGASGMTGQTQQILEGLIETINMIVTEIASGLSSMGEEGSGKSKEEKPLPKKVEAQINMPDAQGGIYDIWKYLEVERGVKAGAEIDAIVYPSKDIESLLETVMGGKVSREGLIFMPYYRAKYVDRQTKKLTKYEILVNPKFKGEEKKSPGAVAEGREVKIPRRKSQVTRAGVAGEFRLIK